MRRELGGSARGLEVECAPCDGLRQRSQRGRARARQTDRARVRHGQRLGPREQVGQARARRVAERLTEAGGKPAGQRGGAAHRDLLAEQGAHGDLERVPRPRHAQTGVLRNERAQGAIARELRLDRERIGVEVEESAGARHDLVYAVEGRQPHRELELAGTGDRPHLERTEPRAEPDRASIRVAVDLLHAGCRARREEAEQRGPVERRPEGKPHRQRGGARGPGAPPPQRRRRGAEGRAHGVVELPHAGEACGERDLRQPQIALVEEAPGQVGAACPRDRAGSDTQMRREEPRQVTRADAESRREALEIVAVEASGGDEAQRARHQGGAADPGRGAGGGLRPAAPAGAEAGALGRGGAGEEAHVLAPGRARRADRPAVDPRRQDAGEEVAVEAAVAREQRSVAARLVEPVLVHARTLPGSPPRRSQDSDMDVGGPVECAQRAPAPAAARAAAVPPDAEARSAPVRAIRSASWSTVSM